MTVDIYSLAVISKVLMTWTNVLMTILVILGTFWLIERISFRACLDLLDLWQRWKCVKYNRSWVIKDGEE